MKLSQEEKEIDLKIGCATNPQTNNETTFNLFQTTLGY